MLPTEELFVYVYVLIHDLMLGGAVVVPDRPGPAPACTDGELLAIATCSPTRASTAAPSPRNWPPAAPPSSSRPIRNSAPIASTGF
jgi:hypothetical protein